MNAYEKAQQLGLTGTPAQIVAQMQATGLTPSKIDLGELLHRMNRRKMLTRLVRPADTGEKWSGTVVNMILAVNIGGTADQKDAINEWFSHITGDRNSYFDTTDVAVSAPFWLMRNMFGGQETMPTVADFDAIADLGGGWAFATLTEDEYSADQTAYEAAQAARAALLTIQNRRQAWDTLAASIRSQIESGALADDAAVLAALTTELGG